LQHTNSMRATLYGHRRDAGSTIRPRRRSGELWSCLSLLLFCLMPHAAPATSQINRLAAALADAPESMRADFAVVSIAEMVTDYNAEADRARREARIHAKGGDLQRWAVAVDAYAAKLTEIANSVTPATPVSVAVGTGNSISLDIDGEPVLVSSPRVREQAAFEQRILDRFCNLYPCDDLIAENRPSQPVAATTSTETYWSFSQQAGPSCSTADGLEFQFEDMTNIGRKREACTRIVKELTALAVAIATSLSNGARIDWNHLAVRTLAGKEEQQVELATDGNIIRLPLPALSETTRLFDLLRPWLAAKVAGQPRYPLVIIHADSLMAPLIDSPGPSDLLP
jgi:hypothetical protein